MTGRYYNLLLKLSFTMGSCNGSSTFKHECEHGTHSFVLKSRKIEIDEKSVKAYATVTFLFEQDSCLAYPSHNGDYYKGRAVKNDSLVSWSFEFVIHSKWFKIA